MSAETRRTSALVQYLNETRSELRKVVWPTREQAQTLTIVVLFVVVLMTAILGGMDFVLTLALNLLLKIVGGA